MGVDNDKATSWETSVDPRKVLVGSSDSLRQNGVEGKSLHTLTQGGITCGAIDEPRKSSKTIDERVIINFRDENVVIARFRDKNVVIVISVLSIAFLFYKYGKYI